MEALVRFAEIRDQMAKSYPGDFDLLEDAMQGLELEKAHSLCQALLKSWGEA